MIRAYRCLPMHEPLPDAFLGVGSVQEWYEEKTRQLWLMKSGLNRFLQRQLSMAWERWQFWYEELVEQRRLLAHALAKWQRRRLAMAWNTWCHLPHLFLSAVAVHRRKL